MIFAKKEDRQTDRQTDRQWVNKALKPVLADSIILTL